MAIVIIGKTNSGKSTLADFFPHKIITYTTRPMRRNEVDGIDYHFVSDEIFDYLKECGVFAETTSYKTAFGIWQYGSAKRDYEQNDDVIILNPRGLKAIKKAGIKCFVVYIKITEEEILKRASLRGDNHEEVLRRIKADNEDFEGIEEYCDLILDTDRPEVLKERILYEYHKNN